MFADHMTKLITELELHTPAPHQGESTSLLLDDVTITFREYGQGFCIAATICEVPSEQVELFLAKMLRGNLFFQATSGATLGLDESGAKITLHYGAPQKATYREFKEKFEDFVNTIDFWKGEVKNHNAGSLD